MKKAVIIHGTKGSPEGNWFQAVAAELDAQGFHTFVPQFPTPEGQNLDNWLATFESEIGELDQHSILIGHSVGAVFVLRLLEMIQIPVHTAVFVAGFTGRLGLPEFDALNATFVSTQFDWEKIGSNASHFICLSGSNDPYVPFEQGKQIANSLGVPHLVIDGGGHLNSESGYRSFPRLLEELSSVGVFRRTTSLMGTQPK